MDKADPRDLLDAYDYVRTNSLTTELAKELARLHPDVFVDVVKSLKGGLVAQALMGEDGKRPIEWEGIDKFIASGQMIEAIKRLRDQTGLGLKESKDRVDNRRTQLSKGSW